jgi:hypothetical protein
MFVIEPSTPASTRRSSPATPTLRRDLVNKRWQAEAAPLMESAHDDSGEGSDCCP